MMRWVAAMAVWAGLVGGAHAQGYTVQHRPPGVRYLEARSPHFTLIYQEGLAEEAQTTAAILERTLPGTRALVGTSRRLHMPVVLNAYADRAGGFVTPLPFRQEIEAAGLRGHILSPRFPHWLEAVAPHELTHAVHANAGGGFGVGSVLRWVAPDAARSINLAGPPGINEGIAVYRESLLFPGAGRLHHAPFTMMMRAAAASDRPWSLAQMLERPAYTRPFDRFYVGGAHFFAYLAAQDSSLAAFHRARAFFYRFPVLGYGSALWYGSGRSPAHLGRAVRRYYAEQASAAQAARTQRAAPHVVASADGLVHRRPYWLDDATLVAHVQGYNVRPGFYRLDAATGRRTLVASHDLTEDAFFALAPDTSALLYARYVPDAFAPSRRVARAFRQPLPGGRARRLPGGAHLTAPVRVPGGGHWGIARRGIYNQWVHLGDDGTQRPLTDLRRAFFQQVLPSPTGEHVAVLLNVAGRQGLFRAEAQPTGRWTLTPWVGLADATIFDAAWSADGRHLLFAADPGGVANVFVYDVAADRLTQHTDAAFGALEPALSPDGRTLAYVRYRDARFDLVTEPFAPGSGVRTLPPRTGVFAEAATASAMDPGPPPRAVLSEARPYRAWRHLRPRMVFPTLAYDPDEPGGQGGDVRLGVGAGLGLYGTDPLQRWAYQAEGFYQAGRAWGRFTTAYAGTLLRPSLYAFDVPTQVRVRTVDADGRAVGTRLVGREERGVGGSLSLPVVLQTDVFYSDLSLRLGAEARQERLFGTDGEALTDWSDRVTLWPSAVYARHLQANPRDLLPNAGWVLVGQARVDGYVADGRPAYWALLQATRYLSLSPRRHTNVRLLASVFRQNRPGTVDLGFLKPRGYRDDDRLLPGGVHLRYGAELVQPLWFIDDGFLLLPVFFKALYAYGFAEALHPLNDAGRAARYASVGGGLGLQLRAFHRLDLAFRVGAAYRPDEGGWEVTFR